jgi:hypothetical protein
MPRLGVGVRAVANTAPTATASTTEPQWVPDPSFAFEAGVFSSTAGAHHIVLLAPKTIHREFLIDYPVGYIFQTAGQSNFTLLRAEDPNLPRDLPYSTEWSNLTSGNWAWFSLSDRGVKWEFTILS